MDQNNQTEQVDQRKSVRENRKRDDLTYKRKKGVFSKIPAPVQALFFIAVFAGVYLFGYQFRQPAGNDYYRDMKELLKKEEPDSYKILTRTADSPILVVSPHGGKIELYTSTISDGIAGEDFNYFDFQGQIEAGSNYERLHVTATHYNAPQLQELNSKAKVTLSVHGVANDDLRMTFVGGRDKVGAAKVIAALNEAGFEAAPPPPSISGEHRRNFVNQNASKAGIQLEITTAQRRALFNNWREDEPRKAFYRYVETLNKALKDHAADQGA